MKKVMLLIMLTGWWPKANAQMQAGVGQYVYMSGKQALTLVSVVYCQTRKNWYMEGRYNYEALKTISLYAGKTFEKKSKLSYSATPVIGAVIGRFNGGSAGANSELDYKRLFFSSQCQYTFSTQDRTEDFFYSWSDLSYQMVNNIYSGISIQQTNLYKVKYKLEKGFFLKGIINKWTFPLYVFNPASNERYYVLGLTYDW